MDNWLSPPKRSRWVSALTAGLRSVLAAILFQNLGLSAEGSDPTAAPCQVQVISNEVVVSATEWYEVGHHVLPPGVVENPNQWPFFAWSDTPLGVARTRDGMGYLFFGSDGGDHPFDGHLTERAGSITVSRGTLDHPLGQPAGDPNPPPFEFLLPTSAHLPASMDYVGGGPVYRVPDGEPGAGNLLIVYHAETPANPFWSWLGLAQSTDEGATWQDLGLVISGSRPYNSRVPSTLETETWWWPPMQPACGNIFTSISQSTVGFAVPQSAATSPIYPSLERLLKTYSRQHFWVSP